MSPSDSVRSRWYLSISEAGSDLTAGPHTRTTLADELLEGRAWFNRDSAALHSACEAERCAHRIAAMVLASPARALCHTLHPRNTLPLLGS